jgi:threonine synthase
LDKYLQEHKDERGFILETAHPVKFPDAVESIIGHKIDVPKSVSYLLNRQKQSIKIDADYQQLKEYLMRKT